MDSKQNILEPLVLTSDFANIHLVESYVEDVCKDSMLPKEAFGNVLIAVTEAVNNAIQHGSNGDRNNTFTLSSFIDKKAVNFEIKDTGSGFNFENLPDPTAPENIEKECGRGVFLMRALADKVTYSDKGATVLISFYK